MAQSPWNLTRNRQDILENLYLDLNSNVSNADHAVPFAYANFSIRCTANTTRGYFELPNYWNSAAGPLLSDWPTPQEMTENYNDPPGFNHGNVTMSWLGNPHDQPQDPDASFNSSYLPPNASVVFSPFAPGPLLTSAIAAFGNNSFFSSAIQVAKYQIPDDQYCADTYIPFEQLAINFSTNASCIPWEENSGLGSELFAQCASEFFFDWIQNSGDPEFSREAFGSAIFFAHGATLTHAVSLFALPGKEGLDGRPLFTAPGMDLVRMSMPIPALIIITLLIIVQLTGLIAMAFYSSLRPSWTSTLDAFAILRIGAAMAGELPLISNVESKEVKFLDMKEGWVGAARNEEHEEEEDKIIIGGRGSLNRLRSYRIYNEVDASYSSSVDVAPRESYQVSEAGQAVVLDDASGRA